MANNQIPTGFPIDWHSSGSFTYGSDVFVIVVGKEKSIFAAHKEILTAEVLTEMCEAKIENDEEYRIELPDVEPNIFHGALEYMYRFSVPEALERADMMEGEGLGNLYVFAVRFKMKELPWSILAELDSRHEQSAAALIEAAKVVYKELGRDKLFQFFFVSHIVEQLSLYKAWPYPERRNPEVKISELIAEGGLLGQDLMGAMLGALLDKKLSLVPIQQPKIAPPCVPGGLYNLRPHERSMVPQVTAIARRDWNGDGLATFAFRKGDTITNVTSDYPVDKGHNTWLWTGTHDRGRDVFPATHVDLEYHTLNAEPQPSLTSGRSGEHAAPAPPPPAPDSGADYARKRVKRSQMTEKDSEKSLAMGRTLCNRLATILNARSAQIPMNEV